MTHARLSPSARHRWSQCPASVKLSEGVVSPPSDASISGTRSHALLEDCINTRVHPDARIGEIFTDEHGKWVVDQDRADRVAVAYEYVFYGENTDNDIVEVEVPIKFINPDLNGTADIVITRTERTIEVVDYKDGVVEVPVEDNKQLLQYAIGVVYERVNRGLSTKPDFIKLTIIQPKLALFGKKMISSWDIDYAKLEIEYKLLLDDVERVKTGEANPGDWCKHCPGQVKCPERVAVAIGSIKSATLEDLANKAVSEMSDSDLRELYEAAPLIKALLADCEKVIRERLEVGVGFPGYKLVEGRGTRGWKSEQDVELALKDAGVPESVLYTKSLVSPAKLEKASWEIDGRVTKLSKKKLSELYDAHLVANRSSSVVVPDSDNRPPVKGSVEVEALFAPAGNPTTPRWLE